MFQWNKTCRADRNVPAYVAHELKEPSKFNWRARGESPHVIEKLFLRNLSVLDGVHSAFFDGHSLARHGAGFAGDVVIEEDDEAITVRERTVSVGAMDLVILFPPLVLALYSRDT